MIPASVLVFLLTVLLSVVLTGLVRSYALKRNLVDYPNSRSLHEIPIPRGGGAAILVSVTGCLSVLVATKTLTHTCLWHGLSAVLVSDYWAGLTTIMTCL